MSFHHFSPFCLKNMKKIIREIFQTIFEISIFQPLKCLASTRAIKSACMADDIQTFHEKKLLHHPHCKNNTKLEI